MLLIHILVALASVGFTTFLYFSPSHARLRGSYGLIALTLATGTLLIVSTGANMLRACMTGLLYVGAMSAVAVMARRKLAAQEARNRSE